MQSGIENFKVSWISKASAAQRAGRAGRTGPGHCYRLYSSAFFENHLDAFTEPEILRTPIDGLVLQMKSMHIEAVVNFPFPTPPDRYALSKAEKILLHLGALAPATNVKSLSLPQEPKQRLASITQVTDLGRSMSLFPVSPRFSKMLVTGQQHGCLPYVVALVASMAVGDPFIREGSLNEEITTEEAEYLNNRESELDHNPQEPHSEVNRLRRKSYFQSQDVSQDIRYP